MLLKNNSEAMKNWSVPSHFQELGMSPIKIEQITGPMACGEAPHWDSDRKQLYLVDIPKALIFRYDPATNKVFSAKVGKFIES